MHIEELGRVDLGIERDDFPRDDVNGNISRYGSVADWNTKRVLIGAGARLLFYPTLFYNVVRNRFQAEFRWWDRVDEFVLLGAVPFPSDVLRLKELGVGGVVTLNEPYETLVPTSLYCAHDIDHLVIPTRDYLFAPSMTDIWQAVDFIHTKASCGRTTYVHCKAGRGRSTTIVMCYLVQYRKMTPVDAYSYLRSIRPRVLLASAQWQAVQEFYCLKVKNSYASPTKALMAKKSMFTLHDSFVSSDDFSMVIVTNSDLDGYDPTCESSEGAAQIWADLSVIYRVRVASQAAVAKLSCLWLRCHTQQKIAGEQNLCRSGGCTISADQIGSVTVDIRVC